MASIIDDEQCIILIMVAHKSRKIVNEPYLRVVVRVDLTVCDVEAVRFRKQVSQHSDLVSA